MMTTVPLLLYAESLHNKSNLAKKLFVCVCTPAVVILEVLL